MSGHLARRQAIQITAISLAIMPADTFSLLDRLLESGDRAGSLDFLIARFRETVEPNLLFEALLMKKRLELGLPLIQTQHSSAFPAEMRGIYEQAMIDAAREAGELALAHGDIARAWPYLRAVGDSEKIAAAIDRYQSGEDVDAIISIAFNEGVHPAKGLELIFQKYGMCRALTSFGMYGAQNGREKCIALLVRELHAEVVERMARTIEANEGQRPDSKSLPLMMNGRDWLFGEYDAYVDTSHLVTVLPYSLEVTEPAILELLDELCEYGQRLSPMFQSKGQPPFEQPFLDYAYYIRALRGSDVEKSIAHFREKAASSDPYEAGPAPAENLVNLLLKLGRNDEALCVSLEYLANESSDLGCPSTLQLCHLAKDYGRLQELARERGDVLSYIAAVIERERATSLTRV